MATDLSEAEPVHHKALPLLAGAQLIHTDKLSEKVEDDTMPIRRTVNSSSRETPPKSKPAEGEEVKAEFVSLPNYIIGNRYDDITLVDGSHNLI
ncbi:heterochromatin protein 1-binding protein 3 [Limosa lapponica baueri]|uniref:Heterochromatin protein 1-binding protein 3 n=1 Tax=Limosa lapponica baueri TaxID=1758121 RepID=A0A2I0T1X2_LIMLA|nr:heterochromatin protein 1-binding protein 3 [Limosa lapponica baueri]